VPSEEKRKDDPGSKKIDGRISKRCPPTTSHLTNFSTFSRPPQPLTFRATEHDCADMGVTTGGKGSTRPRAPNHYRCAEPVRGAPENINNVTSTFFSEVLLLPKDLRFEHGGAKLASCPGRHLTSAHPCVQTVSFL